MANTYTQLNIHAVFAVRGREHILRADFRYDLFKYMSGILKNDNCFPLAINGWTDHVHVFFELNPSISVAKQIQLLKASSSKWINDNNLVQGKFNWQSGYGAFSYSKSQRNPVIQYIINQETHHQQITFKDEYLKLLHDFDVSYNPEYLFEFY